MIAPRTLAQRLADNRLADFQPAIVATLKPLFPDLTVQALAGRIDLSDILGGEVFTAPMIGICLPRIRQPVSMDGWFQLPIDVAAIIVTDDKAMAGRAIGRARLAYAIGLGLFEILGDLDVPRWGVEGITPPTDAEMKPLFTAREFTAGTAYYGLTWRQTLTDFGSDALARMPYTGVEAVEDGEVITYPEEMGTWPV